MIARIIWYANNFDEKKLKKLFLTLCGVAVGSISQVMAEDINVDADDLIEEPGFSVTFSGEALNGFWKAY